MSGHPRRIRIVARITMIGALIGAFMLPGQATALPGDAPIENVSPADGASVPANADGIDIVYRCPIYTSIAELPNGGGMRSYSVDFASTPAVGNDGRFVRANIVAISAAQLFQDNALPEGQCRARFADPVRRPQRTPGTYYWQVTRLCASCAGGYEVGPIWNLTITLTGATSALTLTAPAQAYDGFPIIVPIAAIDIPAGATVVVEAANSNGWRPVGTGNLVSSQARVPVVVAVGDTRVRASVGSPGAAPVLSAESTITVTKAVSWPSGKSWVGAWKGSVAGSGPKTVSFTVTGSGKTLSAGRFVVPMLCPSPGLNSPFTTQIATALVPPIKVAPDGTFVYVGSPAAGHAVFMSGRLAGRSATGTIQMSLGNCTGSLQFTAAR